MLRGENVGTVGRPIPTATLSGALAELVAIEAQAYASSNGHHQTFKQNLEEAIHLYFLDNDFVIMRSSSLQALRAQIRQIYANKLRKALSTP